MMSRLKSSIFLGITSILVACNADIPNAQNQEKIEKIHLVNGVQPKKALHSLKSILVNESIIKCWVHQFATNEYVLVYEENQEEEYTVIYLNTRTNNPKQQEIVKVMPPYGECELPIEKVVIPLKDCFIIKEKGYGSGYCADFPKIFSLKKKKLLLHETVEIVTFSFPEFSKNYYQSDVTYTQTGANVYANITRFTIQPNSKDTIAKTTMKRLIYSQTGN